MKLLKLAMTGMVSLCLVCPAFAADTIKIGAPGAHTGDLASYGLPSLNAAKLVVEEFNAKGGVLGKQVEIIAQDDQCKPEMGTNAATKLLSEGVVAVMGAICSGATKAALPIYKDAKMVSISPSATTPDLTESGENPFFFRTIASDSDQGYLAAAFLQDNLKLKSVAFLHDKGDYGRGFATYAKDFLEKEGKVKVVLFEGITPGAVDYTSILQKVRQSGAEAIIYGGYHPEASKLVQQMNKRRMKIAFISDDGVKDEAFIKVAGPDAEGVYATGPKDVSSLPLNIAAKDAHLKKFGVPHGAFYENAHAATTALLTAIDRAGSTDTDKIMDALRNQEVDTALGKIKFDAKGDAVGVGFSIYQVQNGKHVEIK